MIVAKEFSFSASHFLTQYYGKCEHLHGHNYRLRISVSGTLQKNGMVIDFVLLKKLVQERILSKLDHRHLNDFFENPTAEAVAKWIWEELSPLPEKILAFRNEKNFPEEIRRLFPEDQMPETWDMASASFSLFEVRLWETEDSFVAYQGQ